MEVVQNLIRLFLARAVRSNRSLVSHRRLKYLIVCIILLPASTRVGSRFKESFHFPLSAGIKVKYVSRILIYISDLRIINKVKSSLISLARLL